MKPITELFPACEVQTRFHWKAEFSGAPFNSLSQPLQLRVTTIALPKLKHDAITVKTHGYPVIGPGLIRRNGTITLTYFESVGAEVIEPIYQWAKRISNHMSGDMDGKQTVAYADLFGTITLSLQNKEEKKTTQTYTLQKCILVDEFDVGSLEAGADDVGYFENSITVGYSWYDWGKESGTDL